MLLLAKLENELIRRAGVVADAQRHGPLVGVDRLRGRGFLRLLLLQIGEQHPGVGSPLLQPGDLGVQACQFLDGGLQIRADGAFAFFEVRFAGVVQLEVGRELCFGLPAFGGQLLLGRGEAGPGRGDTLIGSLRLAAEPVVLRGHLLAGRRRTADPPRPRRACTWPSMSSRSRAEPLPGLLESMRLHRSDFRFGVGVVRLALLGELLLGFLSLLLDGGGKRLGVKFVRLAFLGELLPGFLNLLLRRCDEIFGVKLAGLAFLGELLPGFLGLLLHGGDAVLSFELVRPAILGERSPGFFILLFDRFAAALARKSRWPCVPRRVAPAACGPIAIPSRPIPRRWARPERTGACRRRSRRRL